MSGTAITGKRALMEILTGTLLGSERQRELGEPSSVPRNEANEAYH